MNQHHASTWEERIGEREDNYQRDQNYYASKMQFKHAHSNGLGVWGHILHMGGMFIPVVAGELIESPAKYKKVVRLASVGTALGYELLYTIREEQRRKEAETKAEECCAERR